MVLELVGRVMHKFSLMKPSIIQSIVGARVVAACAAVAAVFAVTSCQVLEAPEKTLPELAPIEETPEVVEPVVTPIGTVLAVGKGGAFVVVRVNEGVDVAIGEKLSVMFAGTETAVVKVAPQRTDNLVTADVVIGSPAKDSQVVRIDQPGTAEAYVPSEMPPPVGGVDGGTGDTGGVE